MDWGEILNDNQGSDIFQDTWILLVFKLATFFRTSYFLPQAWFLTCRNTGPDKDEILSNQGQGFFSSRHPIQFGVQIGKNFLHIIYFMPYMYA